jgi:hypothetical protein
VLLPPDFSNGGFLDISWSLIGFDQTDETPAFYF